MECVDRVASNDIGADARVALRGGDALGEPSPLVQLRATTQRLIAERKTLVAYAMHIAVDDNFAQ
ncbi:MAG: hypothetical protein ACJ71T_12760 [Actinomycetales bacterium]